MVIGIVASDVPLKSIVHVNCRADRPSVSLTRPIEGDAGTRSVREAMAEFSMTRSNALSYLYMLQKDHGIGYDLVGDTATVKLPEGCTNPFDVPWGEDEEEEDWLK